MGIVRVTREDASVVFGCGHEHTFGMEEMQVRGRVIEFPPCPTCKRVLLFVQCVDGQAPEQLVPRYRAIQTLHQRLVARGRFAPGSTGDVGASLHAMACDDDVVEDPNGGIVHGE